MERSTVWRPRRGRARGAEWAQTKGTVLSSTVQLRSAPDTTVAQVPLVLYAYEVGGVPFRGTCVHPAERCTAADTVARYPAGSTVTVNFDPADPSRSMLADATSTSGSRLRR